MTNVIAFPSKVFGEWEPISQALTRYLHSLGASTHEVRHIVDGLQVKWLQYGVPLTRPVLRQVTGKPPSRPVYPNDAGIKFHSREMPRRPGRDRAQSLFELAKSDFDQSRSS